MTHIELKELLLERIGWKQIPSTFSITLDAENLTSDSGRYFNSDEHQFVTLPNIYETIDEIEANATVFNSRLKDLKSQVILLVLSDVFSVTDIQDDVITNREALFDNAISKRMAIVIGELILTSTRTNTIERMTKQMLQKLFFEINGSEGNPNFPNYIGLKSRYGQEIKRLKDTLNQEDMLDVNTMRLPNYESDENQVIL